MGFDMRRSRVHTKNFIPVKGFELLPWQKSFLDRAYRPGTDIACLSVSRGNGKSALCGLDAYQFLKGTTNKTGIFVAASVGQVQRTLLVALKGFIADDPDCSDFRITENPTTTKVIYKPTGSRVIGIAANPKTSQGLTQISVIWLDEPASWETRGGALMWEAIEYSLAKPGNDTRIIAIGTRAPNLTRFWRELLDNGTGGNVFVKEISGDPDKWREWREVLRCNPLIRRYPESKRLLRAQFEKALTNSRDEASFKSYRMNIPTDNPHELLLTPAEIATLLTKPVPPQEGQPIIGIDLGGGRAWTGATALWRNGRTECLAIAAGLPSIEEQEARDSVAPGDYSSLVNQGTLIVDHGKHCQTIPTLIAVIKERWGTPECLVADSFNLKQLRDHCVGFAPVQYHRGRWTESSWDIQAVRRLVLDGSLAIEERSRDLLLTSLQASRIDNDSSGNARFVKAVGANKSRDDICVSWALAAGELLQRLERPEPVAMLI